MNGVILKVFLTKGYGFVLGEDNQSRFFHVRDLTQKDQFNQLHEGQKVTFTPTTTEKGPRATEVA